jgi:DNA-directed RNA polymerase subunit M/transcription elongation factor TFIIS
VVSISSSLDGFLFRHGHAQHSHCDSCSALLSSLVAQSASHNLLDCPKKKNKKKKKKSKKKKNKKNKKSKKSKKSEKSKKKKNKTNKKSKKSENKNKVEL